MLKGEILRKIQLDIRKNFGKTVNWESIPKKNFNCYMYAISNTMPTEILDIEYCGDLYYKSLIGENVTYFGDIGNISGKNEFKNIPELVEALRSDLDILGIKMSECLPNKLLLETEQKIAFYYDLYQLYSGKHGGFHFIKQDCFGEWSHKTGWGGDVKKIEVPIESVEIVGLDLIGYFQIGLK